MQQTKAIDMAVDRAVRKVGPKIIVIFGGNRSGKSESGGIITARVLDEMPTAKVLLATIETKLSVNVQQKKLAQYIRKSGIMYGSYDEVRGWKNNVIVGKGGYQVQIKTYAQGREAFQGDFYDLIWLDEECDWSIFQECIMRTVETNGALLLTFTSLMGFTRLVNFLWSSNNPEVWSTVLDLFLNPYIAKEDKDIIMSTIDPDEIESRIHGKPHMKQGLVYKEFTDIHKIPRFDYAQLVVNNPKRYEIHEGIDPHERTPHAWLRFLYDKHQDIVYVVEELKAPRESMIIRDFSSLIKAHRIRVIGGFVEPTWTQIDTSSMRPDVISVHADEEQENIQTVRLEFFRCGIQTVLVSKDNAMGISAVKERMKVVKTISNEVKRKPLFYVFDDLKGVQWEFTRYSWDTYVNDKASERNEQINNPQKKDDHYMDLIKYECIKLKLDRAEYETHVNYDEPYKIG